MLLLLTITTLLRLCCCKILDGGDAFPQKFDIYRSLVRLVHGQRAASSSRGNGSIWIIRGVQPSPAQPSPALGNNQGEADNYGWAELGWLGWAGLAADMRNVITPHIFRT